MKPDIIVRKNHAKRPMFDLILGIETLVKFGVILDFKRKVLTIDHHELTMRPLGAFSNIKKLYRIAKGNDDLLRISPNITPKSQFPKAPPILSRCVAPQIWLRESWTQLIKRGPPKCD